MARLEGTQLGNYELLEHMGTGGMAEVYRARQLNAFGREVAIKIIKRSVAEQPLFRERFLREGQATARLAHPPILPLIELGIAGRRGQILFLAMPHVRDGTLRNLLARTEGMLPIQVITPLFIQLSDAVQYAHEQGLVHRDIRHKHHFSLLQPQQPCNSLCRMMLEGHQEITPLQSLLIASIQTNEASSKLHKPQDAWRGLD